MNSIQAVYGLFGYIDCQFCTSITVIFVVLFYSCGELITFCMCLHLASGFSVTAMLVMVVGPVATVDPRR
jgi:hypothetical protein